MFDENSLKKTNIFPLMLPYKTRTNQQISSSSNLYSSYEKKVDHKFTSPIRKFLKISSLSSIDDNKFRKIKLYLNLKKKFQKTNSPLFKYYNFRRNQNLNLTNSSKKIHSFQKTNLNFYNSLSQNLKHKYSEFSFDKNTFSRNNSILESDDKNTMINNNKYEIDNEFIEKIKSHKLDFELFNLIGKKNNSYRLSNSLEINKYKFFESEKMKRLNKLIKIKKENYNQLNNNINIIKKNKEKLLNITNQNDSYLKYLSKYSENQYKINSSLLEKRNILFKEVKNLELIIKNKNNKFQHLKDMRNFLIKVKEKRKNLPSFFNLLEEGNLNIENEKKEEIEKYKMYLNIKIPIFEKVEDLEKIFINSKKHSLNNLYKNEKIQFEIEELKSELKKLKKENDILFENKIKLFEELKNKLLHKNKELQFELNELIKKNESYNKRKNKNSFKEKKKDNFNKTQIIINKYNSIIRNNPLFYSLLFQKLIQIIKYFYFENTILSKELITKAITFHYISLNDILNYDINSITQEKIYNYILICLQLYEKIIVTIINKNNNYLNSNSTKDDIIKLIKKRKNEINIQNIKEKKILLEKKNKFKIIQVKDKLNKVFHQQMTRVRSLDFVSSKKIKKQKSMNNFFNNNNLISQFLEN